MATNPLSTMRFHRSLSIFVIIFTRFSLISQSILNRFSCNFAGTTCNYSGDCPEKFVEFERVFLKLLVRLVVNLLEYFKIYSFRRQFRHQFSTVYHVILQAPLDASSSIQLSATGRLLDITYMCYEFRTPLFPAQLLQARQSDLSVTSIPQPVNRWRHNEYSCGSDPLHFVPALHTPVVKVRLVVWRSDLTGQGALDGITATAL